MLFVQMVLYINMKRRANIISAITLLLMTYFRKYYFKILHLHRVVLHVHLEFAHSLLRFLK